MIKIDVNQKYTQLLSENNFQGIACELKSDLTTKAQLIYEKAQNSTGLIANVVLQSSNNSLRRSVGLIQVQGSPLFENQGQCLGASIWAIALFHVIKKNYPEVNTAKLLAEIVKEFSEGVGIHAAVLQKCCEVGKKSLLLQSLDLTSEQKSNIDLKKNEIAAELLKCIPSLEDGAYILSFPGWKGFWTSIEKQDIYYGHATAIFIEQGNYFFWDINSGLVGTGKGVGTGDKVQDIVTFLTIAANYAPLARARRCFEEGIQKIVKTFPREKAAWIDKLTPLMREIISDDRGWLSAFEIWGLVEGLKNKVPFSDEEYDQLLSLLCLEPGHMYFRLEQSEGIGLFKYKLKD